MNSQYINGHWTAGSEELSSISPATQESVWRGTAATPDQVDAAVAAAGAAQRTWEEVGLDGRIEVLGRFGEIVKDRAEDLARAISTETGKPLWEARTEAAAVTGKLEPSIAAYHERCGMVEQDATGGATSRRFFRPIGTMAVISPFNFPAHMANGHIVPALLAGNTVILKPSEQAPLVSELIATYWSESGLPAGAFNLVQGRGDTAAALVQHPDVGGIAFTGSVATGVKISQSVAHEPWKLLALEMGGNSPLVVWDFDSLRAALAIVINSTFITSGQRCSAARRLIVSSEHAAALVEGLVVALSGLSLGEPFADPQPYMGPVISTSAAREFLSQQDTLLANGGLALLESGTSDLGPAFVTPGLIDMTEAHTQSDEEVFGPLLQLTVVEDFDAAIVEANGTRFGLAAGLVSSSRDLWERFRTEVAAGILTWNQQLTGASAMAPFGGIKTSGNHRPAGYLSSDYTSYGVGALERDLPAEPANLPPGVTLPE